MFKTLKQTLWGALFGTLIAGQAIGQTATLLPNAKQQFFTPQGIPAAAGTVDMYVPSTTTRKTTWKSPSETVGNQNTNPVLLDGGGYATIYGDGQYRQVVKDADGNTIWDAVTASTGGGGSTPVTPTVGDGNIVGTILPWAGLVAPPNYVFAYGQAIVRADYPLFVSTVTIAASVICTGGLNILSGIADTHNIRIGAPVEASCVPPGTTVTAVTANSTTVSAPAATSTAVTATFFPYGNGNGSTTLNVPDLRGLTLVGQQNMGGTVRTGPTPILVPYWNLDGSNPNALGATGGSSNHPMTISNLPPYTPIGTITNGAITSTFTGLSGQTGLSGAGGAQAYASGAFASSQITGTVASSQATSTFTGAPQGGTTVPFPTIQPSITMGYVIKVLPDVSSVVASGVASIGGMTGVINCGTGVTCGSNTISTTGTNVPAASVTFVQTGTGATVTTLDALLRAQYYTPQMFGFQCTGTTEANIIQTVVNALPSYGGNIYIPAGSDCRDSGTVTIGSSKTNVNIFGATKAHGNSLVENDNVSKLTYTGTAARYIDARGTVNLGLSNLALTYSSSSFTGILVDDSGAVSTISGNYLGPSTNRTGTATLLVLSSTVDARISQNFFYHGSPAIKGQAILGNSTVIDIYKNIFSLSETVPIQECGETWTLRQNSFEALSNGRAGAFTNTVGLPCYGMVWAENWFGDITAISGQWITGYFEGFTFSGNRMAGDLSLATNGINILGGNGFAISGGNRFEALSTAVNFANAVVGCVVNGNYFTSTSVKVGGSSNCTNINTNGNSPSTSQFAVNQIGIGQTSADPLPKTLSGAGTLAATGALTINLGTGATITGLLPNANLANPATTVNGQVCTLGSTCTISGSATSVAVGTTTITSGTTTRVLFDNAGVLGEYSISGSGNVAMTTSPTFVTPALGTPASGNLANTSGYPVTSIAGLGAGVVTALATAVGTAGSVVVNGGVGAFTNTTNSGTLGVTGASTLTGTVNVGATSSTTDKLNVVSSSSAITSIGIFQSGVAQWSVGMTSGTATLRIASGGIVGTGTDFLTISASGLVTVPGTLNFITAIQANGTAGVTKTCTIAVGNVLTFTLGILTATSGAAGCV